MIPGFPLSYCLSRTWVLACGIQFPAWTGPGPKVEVGGVSGTSARGMSRICPLLGNREKGIPLILVATPESGTFSVGGSSVGPQMELCSDIQGLDRADGLLRHSVKRA